MTRNKNTVLLLAGGAVAIVGFGSWLAWHSRQNPHRSMKLVYSSQGYGGMVAVPAVPSTPPAPPQPVTQYTDPVDPVRAAYNRGHYQEAASEAKLVIARAAGSKSVTAHENAAFARQLLAYSAARQHDLKSAREQFAVLRNEAAKLPDKGKQKGEVGESEPTLEAEGAFQHAVCTSALGDTRAAETEYVNFMKQYPDSPLIYAALKRLQKMHGGDATSAEVAVWNNAKQVAREHEKAAQREASLCGPECLVELLRRQGRAADAHKLADEMGTSDQGTSMAAMARAANSHGLSFRGVGLTQKGLTEQTLPVVALLSAGHYVLVDAVTPQKVTIWDPDADGAGKGASRDVPISAWQREWGNVALAVNSGSAILTAKSD